MRQKRFAPSNDARLLLVDDDPFAIHIMGRMLSQYPSQRFATSGEVALRLARELTPDLILLDVEMPGMTGFDVCEALKSDLDLAHVPVIFVTSHNTPAAKTAALHKGAADFVVKPLAAARLRSAVQEQLRTEPLAQDHVRSHLATEAHGTVLVLGSLDDRPHHTENGEMQRFVDVTDARIRAISCQGILDQIVGA